MTFGTSEGSQGLAWSLKNGTKASHQEAERVHFIHEFVKGNISRESYCKLLVNLRYVYQVMEELWDRHWEHPLLEPLYFPEELSRTSSLEADCEFFGIDLSLQLPSKATLAYATQLRTVADSSPELLLAHAYVRYLGDLSGGQVLKKAAIRGLRLTADGNGTQFYEFSRIPGKDFKKFKDMYRARMDTLPVDAAQLEDLVDEANLAFKLNMEIFTELDRIEVSSPPPQIDSAGSCAACPFAHLANLADFAMPDGHPTVKKKGCEVKRILAKDSCSKTCPLSHFGRHAPRIATVVLPFALAAGRQFLDW